MILLIDNYDSFSYNLYQLIGTVNPDIKVIRNDELSLDEIKKLSPEYIIISQSGSAFENSLMMSSAPPARAGFSKAMRRAFCGFSPACLFDSKKASSRFIRKYPSTKNAARAQSVIADFIFPTVPFVDL